MSRRGTSARRADDGRHLTDNLLAVRLAPGGQGLDLAFEGIQPVAHDRILLGRTADGPDITRQILLLQLDPVEFLLDALNILMHFLHVRLLLRHCILIHHGHAAPCQKESGPD